ncbi:hypothetical protein [Frankia sp. Cppng1_Ct_nod]|uniref:hypothetical protein n=1 Tax=Frankia sp. Cppng1_Ct_nod TaxID=2897162 RepID=UPI0013EFBC6F|nr:hypothetical protein [Frankia sp. Cppng1_Ct_nod]
MNSDLAFYLRRRVGAVPPGRTGTVGGTSETPPARDHEYTAGPQLAPQELETARHCRA